MELSRHLLREMDALRSELALALHDDVLSGLATLKLRMEAQAAKQAPAEASWLSGLCKDLMGVMERARTVAHETWPPELDALGLREAILTRVQQIRAACPTRIEVEMTGPLSALDRELEIVLYRVVQEGLTNILKHAQASCASLQMGAESGVITVTIRDNGKGFAPQRRAATPMAFGLLGMRHRVESLGGRLGVESVQGKGTTLVATLPLTRRSA